MFDIVIDTGGTFTDAVLMDESRSIRTAKFLTDTSEPCVLLPIACLAIILTNEISSFMFKKQAV